MVQFFIGGELVKSHSRKVRGKQTDFSDYTPVMWNQSLAVKLGRRIGCGLACVSAGAR